MIRYSLQSVRPAWRLALVALAGVFLTLGAVSAAAIPAAPVTIDEPGFEAVGKWKRSDTGGEAETITYLPRTSLAAAVDKVPRGGDHLAYSDGDPAHHIYQVLTDTLAANTAYTISIVAIDRSDTEFSPFQLRLGHVPGEDDGTENDVDGDGDGIANDHFGEFLLKPAGEVRPNPQNGDEADDGYKTWTTTFITKERPGGLGKPLRIEIVGRGVQSLFDNVRMEAVALPVIVMLGDSTTDQGLPWVVKKQIDARIEPLLERPSMINAGKGGDNATSALERLEKEVLAHKPDIVTVSFGLNDTGGRNPDQYGESLRTIVKTLKAAGIEVILMTSTPFNNDRHSWGEKFKDLGGLDQYMNREFCERMRTVAKEEDVLLCDLHTIFKAEIEKDPDLINKVISQDGVHLTGDGLNLMAKHIVPILHKLLSEEKKVKKTTVVTNSSTYTNPVIPGDWSDPGIVRVGEDYYSVRSSFGWQPGLHIAHSRDLIHWRYIGFADTENAFERKHGITEPGIWGSDIGCNPNNQTFLVYAPMGGNIRVFSSDRPEGPYKDGGNIAKGYDPGFFADDDGQLYLTKSGGEVYKLTPDGLRIDGDPIVKVAGGEGPEIFKANGYYYYLISPGGTRPYQDHMIMSYRAKSLDGPWEEDPQNPVMHAPHTTKARLQGPGHGEVIQTQHDEWYLSYHAYELSHYSLGRQTCLEPVTWTDDGWWRPVNGRIPSDENKAPSLKQIPYRMQDSDEFDSAVLGKQWFFHAEPDFRGGSWSLTERPGYLRIKTPEGDISSPSVAPCLFLQRVKDKKFDIVAEVEFDAQEGHEAAGIHLYHDPEKSIWLTTTVADGQKMLEVGFYDKPFKSKVDPATLKPHEINKTYRSTPKEKKILARAANTVGNKVFLKMSVDGQETVRFFFSGDGKDWTMIDAELYFGDSWHCSRLGKKPGSPDLGWVGCGRDNVWTGTVMGVFACRNGAASSRNADFRRFEVITH